MRSLYQVSREYIQSIDFCQKYTAPITFLPSYTGIEHPIILQDAVCDIFIYIYTVTKELAESMRLENVRGMYLTPRQFIDFNIQFTNLYLEKRSDIENRHQHLVIGLDKLKETVEQVEVLRACLCMKDVELMAKTSEANDKLKIMVKDQTAAENNRESAIIIQQAIELQNTEISARRKVVDADLAVAEPAVLEAKESVSNIKRQHLNEMRAMLNPPSAVKITMEAVCIMLGYKVDSWKAVQSVLRREDFIGSVVNYSTDYLTKEMKSQIINVYINDPNFTYEAVNRASKACGPLCQWTIAQVAYADIMEKVLL